MPTPVNTENKTNLNGGSAQGVNAGASASAASPVISGVSQKMSDVTSKVSDVAKDIGETIQNRYGNIGTQISDISEQGLTFVRKYPLYSVLGAVALGFTAGALIKRK